MAIGAPTIDDNGVVDPLPEDSTAWGGMDTPQYTLPPSKPDPTLQDAYASKRAQQFDQATSPAWENPMLMEDDPAPIRDEEKRLNAMLSDRENLGGVADDVLAAAQDSYDVQDFKDGVVNWRATAFLLNTPVDQLKDEDYQKYQTMVSAKLGKDVPKTEAEYRQMLADYFGGRATTEKAYNELHAQAAVDALEATTYGTDFPMVQDQGRRIANWMAKYPEVSSPGREWLIAKSAGDMYAQTLADLADVREYAAPAYRTLLDYTQGKAGDEEMGQLANKLRDLTPAQMDKINGYVALAAETQQIDRGDVAQFGKNLAQSLNRGFDWLGTMASGDINKEVTAENNRAKLDAGADLYVVDDKDAGGGKVGFPYNVNPSGVANQLPKYLQMAVVGDDPKAIQSQADLIAAQGLGEATPRDAAPLNARKATKEERDAYRKSMDEAVNAFRMARQLRNLASTGVDPIRPIATGFWTGAVERGAYGLAGSVGLIGAVAVNPFLGMAAYSTTEFERIKLENPEMNTQAAGLLSVLEGGLNAVIDEFQLSALAGKSKLLGGVLAGMKGGGVFNYAKRAALLQGEQFMQENLQDLIAPVTESIASALRTDMPDKDFMGQLSDYWQTRPEVFFAVLPLALLGGGFVSSSDFRNLQKTMTPERLRGFGFSEETIAHITSSENPAQFDERFREATASRSKEDIKRGIALMTGNLENLRATDLDHVLSEERNADGTSTWVLHDFEGKEVGRFSDYNAATEVLRQNVAANLTNEKTTLRELAKWAYKVLKDPTILLDQKPVSVAQELERMKGIGDEAGIVRLMDRLKLANLQDKDFNTLHILGETTIEQVRDGVYRAVIKLHENSSPRDALEEINHGFFKTAMASGKYTIGQYQTWLEQTEKATGKVLPRGTEMEVIESLAQVTEDYLTGRIDDTSMPVSFVDYIKKIALVFKEALVRYLKMDEAFKAGSIDTDFKTALEESLGIDPQIRMDRQRTELAEKLDPSLSVRDTGPDETPGEDATTEAGTPAEDVPVEEIDPSKHKEEEGWRTIPWDDSDFSIRVLPSVFPVMDDAIFQQILKGSGDGKIRSMFIDRMIAGGDYLGIPLQGGMFFPAIVENLKAGVVWAFNSKSTAMDIYSRAMEHGGYMALVLMVEGNIVGNKTFALMWFEQLRRNIKASKKILQKAETELAALEEKKKNKSISTIDYKTEKKRLDKLVSRGALSTETALAELNRIRSNKITEMVPVLDADNNKIQEVDPATGTPRFHPNGKPVWKKVEEELTGHRTEWKTLAQAENDIVNMPQGIRAKAYFQRNGESPKGDVMYGSLLTKGNAALGFPDGQQMVADLEVKGFKGIPSQTIIGIIQIDAVPEGQDPVMTADQAGTTEHLSYKYVLKGKPVARLTEYRELRHLNPKIATQMFSQDQEAWDIRQAIAYSVREQDTRYLELAKDPEANKAELQRMVDEAAKMAGYDPIPMFHGTKKRRFYVFDPLKGRKRGIQDEVRTPNFFSSDEAFAEDYANYRRFEGDKTQTKMYRVYLKVENLWDYRHSKDAALSIAAFPDKEAAIKEGAWKFIESPQFQKWLMDNRYDGFVNHERFADNTGVYNPNQIKSADPVTYDDQGNVIPLSQRFNSETGNINYSIGSRAQPDVERNLIQLQGLTISGPANYSIRAWHTSPHKYDKADLSKAGTGEGAAVYGWGFYAAENPEVSGDGGQYQLQFAKEFDRGDRPRLTLNGEWVMPMTVSNFYDQLSGKAYNALVKIAEADQKAQGKFLSDKDIVKLVGKESSDELYASGFVAHSPQIYRIEMDVEGDELLDWDLPFAEQSKFVQNSLGDLIGTKTIKYNSTLSGLKTSVERVFIQGNEEEGVTEGAGIYRGIARLYKQREPLGLNSEEGASKILKERGIKGIRYLDQGSRQYSAPDDTLLALEARLGSKEAAVDEFMRSVYNTPKRKAQMRETFLKNFPKRSYNYVIFDDSLIKILTRNGEQISVEQAAQETADTSYSIRETPFSKDNAIKNREVLASRFEKFKPQVGVQGLRYGWQRPSDGQFIRINQHHFFWRTDDGEILGDPNGVGYLRIAIEGNTLMWQGVANPRQLKELKDTAIEQGLELMRDPAQTSYSIREQSEIDRVASAVNAMNRGPDGRLAVYERAKERFMRLLLENKDALDAIKQDEAADPSAAIAMLDQDALDQSANLEVEMVNEIDAALSDNAKAYQDRRDNAPEDQQKQITRDERDRAKLLEKGIRDKYAEQRKRVADKANAAKETLKRESETKRSKGKAEYSSRVRSEKLMQAVIELDALLSVLPVEVVGKVGGFTTLAKIGTGEKALGKFFAKRVEMVDKQLERYLNAAYDEQLDTIFERAKPKNNQPGEKPKGIGPEIMRLFAVLKEAREWNAQRVASHIAALEYEIANNDLSPEDEAYKRQEAALVALVGNWKPTSRGYTDPSTGKTTYVRIDDGADSNRRYAAVTALRETWANGYRQFLGKQIAFKQAKLIGQDEAIASTGKTGDLSGRQDRALKDNGLGGKFRRWIYNLTSFDQFLGLNFGDNNFVANRWSDRQRLADNQKEDSIQAKAQGLEDLFIRLAGSRLDGEKLRFQMSQKSMLISRVGHRPLRFSELEGLTATMMWMQADGRRHMSGQYDDNGMLTSAWSYDQDFIDQIEGSLSDEALEVRQYLLDNYESEYDRINKVYRELNGIDLPKILFYSPLIVAPHQAPAGMVADPVTNMAVSASSIAPGAIRTRSAMAVAEPLFRDALATYVAHFKQMEHYIAYAPMMREMNGVLRSRNVQNAIAEKNGEQAVKVLNLWLDMFNQGGNRDAGSQLALSEDISNWLGRASQVALVGRIGTLLIQSTQLAAGLAEMPHGAYVVRMSKLLTGNLGWGKALESSYIQRRMNEMPPIVREMLAGLRSMEPTALKHNVAKIGRLISGADALFTAGTFSIVYDYHYTQALRMGYGEVEADAYAANTAERATDRLAQPTRLGSKSIYEITRTSEFARISWAFASDARKTLALAAYAVANKSAGEAGRTVGSFMVLTTLAAALIRNAWRDARDDDDDEWFDQRNWNGKRLLLALTTEPLQGLPFVGNLVTEGMYAATGQYHQQGTLLSPVRAIRAFQHLPDSLTGNREVEDMLKDLNGILATMGLFNQDIAAAASLSTIASDAFGLGKNAKKAIEE